MFLLELYFLALPDCRVHDHTERSRDVVHSHTGRRIAHTGMLRTATVLPSAAAGLICNWMMRITLLVLQHS
jgi:hypothetical protein